MTITAGGEVRAIAVGPATISALAGAFSDTIDATVSTAAPDHVTLSAAGLVLRQQQRVQLRATIVFTDGASADGTDTVTWSTSDATVATVAVGVVDAQLLMGTATISASVPDATAGTLLADVGALRCHVVINEVQAGSNASASDEWAEIYNPCTVPLALDNLTLNYRAANDVGVNDRNFLIALAGTLQPGEIQLFGGNAVPETLTATWGMGVMQRNNGSLALRDGPSSVGPILDAVAYGDCAATNPFIEMTPTEQLDDGFVIARRPIDGDDSENNSANFVRIPIAESTPGVRNNP
jgi:hypothetical protein